MNFCDWYQLQESSLEDLYTSSVDAFPKTTKRQYATNTIKIAKLDWTPYTGLKTLFVRALAQNEGREYNPVILFKNVQYTEDGVALTIDDKIYKLKPLSFENNDVLLRCQCQDFQWRFNYFDHLDQSLYGKKRKKYEALYHPDSANPQKMPGMCKHLMKMVKALQESKILR
jgi:hypothetical protein